jgi:hypothetical protein
MALADSLEEVGQIERAELTRLTCRLRRRLALIPVGKFLMGSPDDEKGRKADESDGEQPELVRSAVARVLRVTVHRRRIGNSPGSSKDPAPN